MSLAVLANHMATKGRHGDDMLVHMSKDEVAALQRLAEQHGLTLTINPETGLPEAFSLKSLISAVAPLALGWALGPAGFGLFETSLGASLAVGGIGALATGSLEKGLMMGLSAYGGSELGQGLVKAGVGATQVPNTAIVPPDAQLEGLRAAATESMTPYSTAAESAYKAYPDVGSTGQAPVYNPATPMLQQQTFTQMPFADKLSNIYQGVAADPLEFAKKNITPLAMAGLPVLASLGSQNTLKGMPTGTDPSQIRFPRKRYNPYTGTYEQLPGFTLADYRSGIMSGNNPMYAADGGIVALADGGVAMTPSYQRTSMSPGMLDFANRSEPVVRMADGGATREDVINAYRNTAGAVVNPDESAINYWMGAGLGGFADAVSGARAGMSAGQTSAIDAARADRQGVLDDVYRRSVIEGPATTKPGQGLVNTGISGTGQADLVDAGGGGRGVLYDTRTGAGAQTVATQPTQANLDTITNVYRNVLGRDPDAVGLNYWAGRLASGESIDSVLAALKGSAQTVLGADASKLAPGLSKSVADAIKTPTTFVSSQGNTIADEWIRNTLGREPNAADMQQPWYQALNKLNTGTDVTAAYSAFQQWAQREKAGVATPSSWFEASQLLKPKTTTTPPTITGGGGNDTITITPTPAPAIYPSVQPTATVPVVTGEPPISRVIPGTTGTPTMTQVRDAYTKGGGNIYAPKFAPKYKGTSGTIGDVNTMVKAYDDFWANTSVGSTINWAGGTLKRIGGGKAVFTGADGSTYELSPGSDLNNIAGNSPAIAEQWRKEFGFIPRNYVTGATLKAQNYLMGQGDYPAVQTPAGGIMKPYWETVGQKDAGKFTPDYKKPTDGGTTIDTSNINPNAPAGMQAAYDKYWDPKAFAVGNEIDWAGGKLKKLSNTDAIFTYVDESGKTRTLHLAPTSRFEDIATNPLIAQYWKNEFGYDPTKHANTPPPNKGGDTGGAKAGGLMSLKRYAEGGAADDTERGHYEYRGGEAGENVWVPDAAPADQGIAAAIQATVADSQAQGAQQAAQQSAAADQGIAALNVGTAEKSALAQAGYNAQTDTLSPTVTDTNTLQDYFRLAYGREGSAAELANLSGKSEADIRSTLSQSITDWNKANPDNPADPYHHFTPSHQLAEIDWSDIKSLTQPKSTVDISKVESVLGGKIDPVTGAVFAQNKDGSTTITFADGSRAVAPVGADPMRYALRMQAPMTGNYGVVDGQYKGYSAYDPTSTITKVPAIQIGKNTWRDPYTGRTYDYDPNKVSTLYGPLGTPLETGTSEIDRQRQYGRQYVAEQYERNANYQPVYYQGATKNTVDLPANLVRSGQWLGEDGNLYQTFEHGENVLTGLLTDKQRADLKAQAQKNPYTPDPSGFSIGPVYAGPGATASQAGGIYKLPTSTATQFANPSAVNLAQTSAAAKQALAQQIAQLGYDPTGRYDPEVMQIVQQLRGTRMAGGGLSKMEQLSMIGGAAAGGQFNLGGYSDGGRLLKGPGDGVSDSIPATIGNKRPARLADGEFVVPARIVSELGNGSTDAGARKLYAMMDRIQANRSKTVGKGKVAVNSRADKYLPA